MIFTAEERIARVPDVIAASTKGCKDAIKVGFPRPTKTLWGITGMRVAEQRVAVENDQIPEYRVRLKVIIVLEEEKNTHTLAIKWTEGVISCGAAPHLMLQSRETS